MQPLFVGPQDLGTQRNLKPFMIPDQAYETLEDVFNYRGRITRKTGYSSLGRLRRVITGVSQSNMTGTTYSISDLLTSYRATQANASIQVGTVVITLGTSPNTVLNDNSMGGLTLTSGPMGQTLVSSSINYQTGAISFTLGTSVSNVTVITSFNYYPMLPSMGFRQRENPGINNDQSLGFDTIYSYSRSGSNWIETPSSLVTTWSGTVVQFFWSANYQQDSSNANLIWVTNSKPGFHCYSVTDCESVSMSAPWTATITAAGNNFQIGDTVDFVNMSAASIVNGTLAVVTSTGDSFNVSVATGPNPFTAGMCTGYVIASRGIAQNVTGDGVRIYNNTTWLNANPAIDGVNVLQGCLLIIPFKGRLVFLNTTEGVAGSTTTNYAQRARWCWNGPAVNFARGWRSDLPGNGGFADAATEESIVTCGLLKDDLIVYFERSTWRLVYTGNEILPFTWQKINDELGADAPFSNVEFDNDMIAFGNVGVHTTNGIAVQRIDQAIPDTVWNVSNNNSGPQRTFAIRDYYLENIYFSYSSNVSGSTITLRYPNKILCYNYINKTWSFFNESFTCFGYFQPSSSITWGTLPYASWEEWNLSWGSGLTQLNEFRIAAGNQQGFTMLLEPNDTQWCENFAVTAITPGSGSTIVTSPNHNIPIGAYVRFINCIGMSHMNSSSGNDLIFQVIATTTSTFTIGTPNPQFQNITGTYLGGGIFRIMQNFLIKTKMFTPFWEIGKRYRIVRGEFLFDTTSKGQITCDIFVDTSAGPSMSSPTLPVLGSNTINTCPETLYRTQQEVQQSIWHRMYYYAQGEAFQLQFYLSESQITNSVIADSQITLNAFILWVDLAGRFL